jgi:hypothetical protein
MRQKDFTVTLVNFGLDEQNSYLFTYNTFIKILYKFRCSSSGGLIVSMQPLVSSLSVGTIRPPEDEQRTARNM